MLDQPKIGEREVAALEAVLAFRGQSASLRHRIAEIEDALAGLSVEDALTHTQRLGASTELLRGALLVKGLAAQIDVVLHAIGILQALPYILQPGERIVGLSLGAGSAGSPFDLETDYQIAEFKFIRWRGNDPIRENHLFVDVFHLAEAETTKRRVLYVTGSAYPLRFLDRKRSLTSVLAGHGRAATEFTERHGDRYRVVSDYWSEVRDRVEVVDLEPIIPGLAALDTDA